MSDVTPETNHETNTNMPDPNFIVKHGAEPVTEAYPFDTPLERAPVHPIPDTVDEFIKLQPTHDKKWPKRLVGLAAVATIGAGAFIAGSRSSEEEQPVEATPTTTQEIEEPTTESTTSTTELSLLPSYITAFEPELIIGPSAENITEQIRQNYFYAIVANTQDLREQYISYFVGDDPELISRFEESIADSRGAYAMSGLNEEEYLEQMFDKWELVDESMVGDETMQLTIELTDPETGASGLTYWFVRQEISMDQNEPNYVVVDYNR